MSASDVEMALRDVSPDDPTGPSLALSPEYIAIHRLAAGTEERQIGDKIIAAEEPDWIRLRAQALELLGRSKDLRLAIYLTLALLKLEGVLGFRDGLAILHGMLACQWEPLHPRLDPSDDLDPQERINILLPLASPGGFGDTLAIEKRLREAPLCDSKFARPSHRDVAIARGELKVTAVAGKPAMSLETIVAAFRDTPLQAMTAISQAAAESTDHVKAINGILNEKVGEGNAPDLSRLSKTLTEITGMINQYGNVRGTAGAGDTASNSVQTGAAMPSDPNNSAVPGEIRSKRDVQVALEQICGYFERHEPSSPIPLLLKGAQRMLSMNFVEIMKILDANALKCLMGLSGEKDTK